MKNNATLNKPVEETPVLNKDNIAKSKKAIKKNLGVLLKTRLATFGFHIGRLVTFAVFAIIFIVVSVISMKWLNGKDQPWLANVFIIADSCVAGILMIVLAIILFRGEAKSNQINLELREGYKPRQIYMSRIVEMAFYITLFMIIAVIVNLVTIGVKGEMNNVLWYHMFVTSLGWYAIVCIIAAGMGIFFSGFLNGGWSGTLAIAVVLIVILIASVIPGVVADSASPKAGSDDYAGEIASKKIDNAALDFAENDLGIYSEEQLDDIVGSYVDVIKSNKDIDWETYGRMTLGIFDNDPFNNGYNNDDDIDYAELLIQNPDLIGAIGAFGNGIFADNGKDEFTGTKLAEFFNDTKDLFKTENKNFKFTDITNWDILDGHNTNKTKQLRGNGEVVNWKLPRVGSTVVSENFQSLVDSAKNNKKFSDKYSFVNELSQTDDANALSLMYNIKGSNSNPFGGSNNYANGNNHNNNNGKGYDSNSAKATENVDYSQKLYPTFGIGGYSEDQTNVQKQITTLANEKQITPAEFLFNRNIMYFVAKAFKDLNVHATWNNGRTILGTNAVYVSDKNQVILYVNNAYEFRYNGVTYGMSSLQTGALPKGALDGLAVTINDKTYYSKDMLNAQYLSSETHSRLRSEYIDDYYLDTYNKVTDHNIIVFNPKQAPTDLHDGGSYRNGKKMYGLVGSIKYSTNPMFMISNSEEDLDALSDGQSDKFGTEGFAVINKWYSDEVSKTVISNINYNDKEQTVNIGVWEPKAADVNNLKTIKFYDDKTEINGSEPKANVNGSYTVTLNNSAKNLRVSFADAVDSINTNLIDGSMFMPSFAYKDSETHKTAISWIYNPLTQLAAMFNGVNYKQELMDNLMNSFITNKYVGMNYLNVRISLAPSKSNPLSNTMKVQRNSYVEIVYIYYVLVEALFVFVGFWMYRKSIVS